MPLDCSLGRCDSTIRWMKFVLVAAGIVHLIFAALVSLWPALVFEWVGAGQLVHVLLCRGLGLLTGFLGVFLLLASRDPLRHWPIVLIGLIQACITVTVIVNAVLDGQLSASSLWVALLNGAVWIVPFAMILWACLRAYAGVPPSRTEPYSIAEAASIYSLSSGETLASASESQLLAIVFLRHFGCTFTRQILRGLEAIQNEAMVHGARLVLVHMLQGGKESKYLGERSSVARIADPRCELYRAFGLGKGGFLELFGPHVWWRGAVSIFKGCGLGHLAGDGLQMPGAFLFHDGKIISAQPAHTASDLPDLARLFDSLAPPNPSAN